MTASKPRMNIPHLKPVRIVRAHIKLFAAAALGVALFLVLPVESLVTRALIAWDVAVGLYLLVAAFVITRFELDRVRKRAEQEDEGGALILILTVVAAVASLAVLFVEEGAGARSLAMPLSTVVLSWTFIHTIFAFHYAHEFYGEAKGGHKGGLRFPDDDCPEYWDFAYFSVGVGITFGATDVRVTSKAIRRVVIAHGIVSFFYNVAVLALMVNIGGELIKGN